MHLPSCDQDLGPRIAALENVVDTAFSAESPDDARLPPREDLDEAALAPAWRFVGAHGNTVAVPQGLHLARGQVQIRAAIIRAQEAEAVAMRQHRAGHHVEMPCQTVFVGPVAQQLSVADHRSHSRLERPPVLLGAYAEARRQRFEQQRRTRLLHRSEYLLATRNLMLVLARCGVRRGRRLAGH
jgi:hypothetical protein